MSSKDQKIKEKVKMAYTNAINRNGESCCTPVDQFAVNQSIAQDIGYKPDEINDIPKDSVENSFGCGNPLAFEDLKKGEMVLDIGSGAGIDTFIASKRVGETGKVYGLDMTPDMIERARKNASEAGITNVEYVLGEANNIPLDAGVVDLVISNCVINLAPDKKQVFKEIFRVLKPGGRIMVSDILSESLPKEVLENDYLYSSCVAGAISESDYLNAISKAGFKDVKIVSQYIYDDMALSALAKGSCRGGKEEKNLFDKHKDQVVGKVSSAKIKAVKPVA